MQYDIRSMKRSVDAITINIKIYKRDLEKNIKTLKEKFGINKSQIDSKISELEKQKQSFTVKEQSYLKKAHRILRGIEDD